MLKQFRTQGKSSKTKKNTATLLTSFFLLRVNAAGSPGVSR